MGQGTWSWIVPDGLWEIAKPLIPPSRVRPQGGGTQDTPDETLFASIIYVLVSGCAWRALPPCFGISKSTAHRRFLIWSRAGLWGRLHRAVLDKLAAKDLLDLSRVVLDTAHVRAKKGGVNSQVRAPWTGVSPVPRCMSCPTGRDCLSWSVSQVVTPTTARG
jgi:transposase